MIIVLASFIALALLVYLIAKHNGKSNGKSRNLPPGSYGWPILGETIDFLGAGVNGNPEDFLIDRRDKYKSQVFKTSMMGERMAVLCGTAGNKFLFSNENKLVTVWWPSSVRKLLGPCLATSGGDEGKLMRRMVSCFVTPDAFTRLYIKTMDLVSQQHINTHWLGKEEVKVFPTIKLYTFELACRLFMSLEDSKQISELAILFSVFLRGIISIPINIPGTRFYNAKKATATIKSKLREIVRQRRAALEQNRCTSSQDLLSHLLASPGEFLQWEDVQKMRYSWNVVCETIRLSPPVIGAFREAVTDINYAGYDIPKGWKVIFHSQITLACYLD